MVVVRTVVTSLPQTASSQETASTEKTYRLDPAPAAPAQASPAQPPSALGKTVLGKSVLSVNLAQLLADLEAESRRVIGPTAPPRG